MAPSETGRFATLSVPTQHCPSKGGSSLRTELLKLGGDMFPHLQSFNLQKWIDDNRGDWGQRRVIWQDSDFIAFVTRGPNRRKDYHINPGDEIFYQLEGELNLHYLKNDKHELAVLKSGDVFLMPKNTPHSPRRDEVSNKAIEMGRQGFFGAARLTIAELKSPGSSTNSRFQTNVSSCEGQNELDPRLSMAGAGWRQFGLCQFPSGRRS